MKQNRLFKYLKVSLKHLSAIGLLLMFSSNCSQNEPEKQMAYSSPPPYPVIDTTVQAEQNWDLSGIYSGVLNLGGHSRITAEVMVVFRDSYYQVKTLQWNWEENDIIKLYIWEDFPRCIYRDQGMVGLENNKSEIVVEDTSIQFLWGASQGQKNLSLTFMVSSENWRPTASEPGRFEFYNEAYSCSIYYFIPLIDVRLSGGELSVNSSGLNFNHSQRIGSNMRYQQDYWELTDYRLSLQANRIIDVYNPASADHYLLKTDSICSGLILHFNKSQGNFIEIILPDTTFKIILN